MTLKRRSTGCINRRSSSMYSSTSSSSNNNISKVKIYPFFFFYSLNAKYFFFLLPSFFIRKFGVLLDFMRFQMFLVLIVFLNQILKKRHIIYVNILQLTAYPKSLGILSVLALKYRNYLL